MDEALYRQVENYIRTMPSLSITVSKVLEICNNPQTSPADLNHVISLDPVLVGRVLKLINSAYYGLSQQVTNLVRAITMLGINTVKNLALSSAIIGNMNLREFQGLNTEGFWRHSLCVGVAAKVIARKRSIDPKLLEEYFTAGLLHDIGKIPLNAVLSKDYLLTVKAADTGRISLVQAETETLGINHCEVGELVVKAWRLEGPIGDVVIFHHFYTDYAGEYRDLLYTVIAANRFAALTETGFSGDRHPGKADGVIGETLGLSWEIFDEIKPIVDEEITKAQVFLNL
ncbi:HDOD domain protein [Treponema primitia ZAS-2]|uniref:HDOD domain protein n=1 Tax=Treponema primitia (strain ATCC BAA-887 / DSM 12427 / ZAS-2) TaxID=545694 RepID=F5YHA0_TREPZ|nr:HDOD domain-containing protein [Treponema primitia]AEF83566.1 HDOD domain protein [Treponema primitia ZAS-2]